MKYHHRLPCENYEEINAEILAYINTLTDVVDSDVFWNPIDTLEFVQATPLMQAWLKSQNLLIKTLAVTVGKTINCCGPHTDTPPAKIKLNWPVLNTTNTWNRWYGPLVESPRTETNKFGGTTYLNPHELVEISAIHLDGPTLIDVTTPHDVGFAEPAVFPRIGLQCQLFVEPDLNPPEEDNPV